MLSHQQLQQIQTLQQLCENIDYIALKLNWETLRTRKPQDKLDYLHYSGDLLTGFLGVYKFGSKFEICGMVHPDFRRQGIFTSLFQKAIHATSEVSYSSLLLNTPSNSLSGEKFLHTISSQYESSEYQMRWNSAHTQDSSDENAPNNPTYEITLRSAVDDDIEELIRLDKEGFGMSNEDVLDMYKTITEDGLENMYVVNSNGVTAGKVNVVPSEAQTWIYAFTVDQALRSQGIGRRTLQLIIEQEGPNDKELWLEVAVHNPKALKLYESCGFVTQEKQDYYQYTG
ncbi:GNAT family N-acetyltransferase [Paenibacillus crassostreae]|uniref:N-acetyltransferase domain-containing protein n=1 Tax=Paenibacillus crassostreae TaxID=1763538 RepID=A0A167DNB7_9BACL|nr:GNAT family N-acetyltransferase [Paenibacillus crassostreae]AOZ91252.1 hypothetical protein LPB68_02895 [Paenibacillus crassostreae]OAB74588.1 hypothetical protein PNBC_11065 [Paenibacillus crassostreae]